MRGVSMKKAILNMMLNVKDDFEPGDCKNCPIHTESYFDTHFSCKTRISCPLSCMYATCPIEMDKEQ